MSSIGISSQHLLPQSSSPFCIPYINRITVIPSHLICTSSFTLQSHNLNHDPHDHCPCCNIICYCNSLLVGSPTSSVNLTNHSKPPKHKHQRDLSETPLWSCHTIINIYSKAQLQQDLSSFPSSPTVQHKEQLTISWMCHTLLHT